MWFAFSLTRNFLKQQSAAKCSLMAVGVVSYSSHFNAKCESNDGKKTALNPDEYRSFRVQSNDSVTHNTKRIVFDLPTKDHEMGLSVASCVLTRIKVNGKNIVRAYTPVNLNEEKGFIELLVKEYPNGIMSKHIANLNVGDKLEMKGPLVKFHYKPNEHKTIGLIAGGTGITPMVQLIKQICRNPDDHTQIVLLYASSTEKDIIDEEELLALQYMYPQLQVHHVISEPSEHWEGLRGRINKEMIKEYMPAPAKDIFICVCGPIGMMCDICGNKDKTNTQGELQGLLKDLQYDSSNVFKF